MKKRTFRVSFPFVFAIFMALTVAVSHPVLAQTAPPAPTNLRVDISDGTNGQLLITWSEVSAAFYNVYVSTSPSGPWNTSVTNCSGTTPIVVPSNTIICRDSGLTPGTTYYYQVWACNGTIASPYAPRRLANRTPTITTLPRAAPARALRFLPAVVPSAPVRVPTMTVIPNALDPYPFPCEYGVSGCSDNPNQIAAYANSAAPSYRSILFVGLPGSGSLCDLSALMYTAENLGF
jgi:hypothetical protein